MKSKWIVLVGALVLGIGLGTPKSVLAKDSTMSVPIKLQAAIFKQLFKHISRLKTLEGVRVAVLHKGDQVTADEVAGEFQRFKVDAKVYHLEEMKNLPGKIDAVYFLDTTAEAADICEKNRILSMTGYDRLVDSGGVSIAVDLGRDRKAKLIVNLVRLQFEDYQIDTAILRMLKMVAVELDPKKL